MLTLELVVIGAVVLSVIAFVRWCARIPDIFVYEDGLQIKGAYGARILSCNIGSIMLVDELPKFTIRTNGYSGTKKLKGFFTIKGAKSVCLSVMNKKEAPFIKIVTTKGTWFINRATSEETTALYDEMKKTIKYEENPNIDSKMDYNKTGRVAVIVVAVAVITLIISLLPLMFVVNQGTFSVKDNEFVVEGAGGYGTTISIDDMKSVQLIEKLPHIARRTNGVAINRVRFGHFRLEDGRKCILYINNAAQNPFIQIETIDNLYIVNCDTTEETDKLYRQLIENN